MFILRGLSAQLQHYYLKVFPRALKFYYSELILVHFTHYNGFTLCFTSVVGVFLFQRSTIYLKQSLFCYLYTFFKTSLNK